MTPSGAAPPRPGPDRHFPCIDGLRAGAAVMVMAGHVAGAAGMNRGNGGLADYTGQLGRLGVSIFFAISGFLLYRPFAAAHEEGRPAPAVGPYLTRRFLRIFPAYWLALVGFLVMGAPSVRDATFGHLVLWFGLLQGYSRSLALSGIPVAWTLTVELAFYLVLPLYAWLVRRLGRTLGPGRMATAEWVGLGGLYLLGMGGRTLANHALIGPGLLIASTDLFAMGMVIAVVRARQRAGGPTPAVFRYLGRYPVVGLALAAELVWIVALLNLPLGFARQTLADTLFRQVCYGLVGFLLVAPLVFGNQQRGIYRRLLRSPPVRWSGEVSYGLYLWQLLVIYLLAENVAPADVAFWPLFGATLAITLVIASASWVLLERPILRLRLGRATATTGSLAPTTAVVPAGDGRTP